MADFLDDVFNDKKKSDSKVEDKLKDEVETKVEDKVDVPSKSNTSSSSDVDQVYSKLKDSLSSNEINKDAKDFDFDDSNKKVIETYGDATIYKIEKEPLLHYMVPVAKASSGEQLVVNTIKEATTRIIAISPYRIKDETQRRNVYRQKVLEIIRSSPELKIPEGKEDFYADSVVRDIVGYGKIDSLLKDELLEEIMITGPSKPVYVFHRKYEMMTTNIVFYSDKEIQDIVGRIARYAGRRIDYSQPLLDARLPDGSRVNATIPPASISGSTLTIRKFRADPYTVVDLIKYGTLDTNAAAFLWLCTEGLNVRPANIIIAGGTGSGKTTTLNVLTSFVPSNERVITIEDTAELNLPLKHWIRLESRPPGIEGTGEITLEMLTKNALRMRPDRVIVGEVRGKEAESLFTAMNTGHDGSIGTVHANSASETLIRIISPPMNVPSMMLSGLQLIVVQNRLHDRKRGTIRRITEISEVSGVLEGKPTTNKIFEWDAKLDVLKPTKDKSKYLKLLSDFSGLDDKDIEKEISKRAKFLENLANKNIRDKDTLAEMFEDYYSKG